MVSQKSPGQLAGRFYHRSYLVVTAVHRLLTTCVKCRATGVNRICNSRGLGCKGSGRNKKQGGGSGKIIGHKLSPSGSWNSVAKYRRYE
jgi:hypothetical protein